MEILEDLQVGLIPIRRRGDSRLILILKVPREMALTARMRKEFRIYLVPVHVDGVTTCGLITAFFDDHDEPLVLCTPLFKEEITQDFLSLISSASFYIHFFDLQNRELLGFRVENPNAVYIRVLSDSMRFVSPSLDHARHIQNEMEVWFGARAPSDDDAACTMILRERLFPDCLEEHTTNPGNLDEPDIAIALRRSFSRDQVFLNPILANNGREFVDVLVVTSKTVVLIQAKDSPSTESALTRTIERKINTAVKHVKRAARQLKGSINHLQTDDHIEIITDGECRNVSISGRNVYGLVIVKERFDTEQVVFSEPIFSVFLETNVPCVILDHTELQQLTYFRTTGEAFVAALDDIFSAACEHNVFPRSRFGLVSKGPVVFSQDRKGIKPETTTHEPVRTLAGGSRAATVVLKNNLVASDAAKVVPPVDSNSDWLRVVVNRSEVEALDVSHAATKLSRVLANRNTVERYRKNVDLAFFGYSNDPRELYDIPEVRTFCSKLDEAFPYWFYFLSTDGVTLKVIASCLCSVTQVRPGVISIGSDDLLDFMTRGYEAMNWLFDNYSLDECHNVEISSQIAKYFGNFESLQ